jgi:Holliday junction resolvase RusA-like endonuclease
MKQTLLTIQGTLPGLNEYIRVERGNRHRAAKLKKQVEQNIGWVIKQQLSGLLIKEPVIMHYLWWEPNRKRDKDNIAWAKKLIQDALVKTGVLEGDSWKHIIGFTDNFAVDQENPRVEIKIVKVKEVTSCDYCGQAI